MEVTEYRETEDGKIRVKYGLHKIGNQPAYFSITAERKYSDGGESYGQQHDAVAEYFPELQPLIKWHLTDEEGTPMHYIANSAYHLEQGNVPYFKSCAVYGALKSDTGTDPEALGQSTVKKWLEDRLPALREAFLATMREFNIQA